MFRNTNGEKYMITLGKKGDLAHARLVQAPAYYFGQMTVAAIIRARPNAVVLFLIARLQKLFSDIAPHYARAAVKDGYHTYYEKQNTCRWPMPLHQMVYELV